MTPFWFFLLDVVAGTGTTATTAAATTAAAYPGSNDYDDRQQQREEDQVRILHEQLTMSIFIISPFVLFYLLCFQPTTYGKLHSSNNNNNNNNNATSTTTATATTTTNNRKSSFLLKYLYLGPMLPARQCWMIFECPPILWSIFGFYYYYYYFDSINPSKIATSSANRIMLLSFTIHYIYRCIIYPLFFMSSNTKFPSLLLLGTIPYTVVNGFLQVHGLCCLTTYPIDYTKSLRFIVGLCIMIVGFCIVVIHDSILCSLKQKSMMESKINNKKKTDDDSTNTTTTNKHNYLIPYGYLFRYISCPHFLGEIIEWIGYSIMVNTTYSWSFAIFTLCNLLPRAISQHNWYLSIGFPNTYSTLQRKAILPFIW